MKKILILFCVVTVLFLLALSQVVNAQQPIVGSKIWAKDSLIFGTGANKQGLPMTRPAADEGYYLLGNKTTGQVTWAEVPHDPGSSDTVYWGYGTIVPGWKGHGDSLRVDSVFFTTNFHLDSTLAALNLGTVDSLYVQICDCCTPDSGWYMSGDTIVIDTCGRESLTYAVNGDTLFIGTDTVVMAFQGYWTKSTTGSGVNAVTQLWPNESTRWRVAIGKTTAVGSMLEINGTAVPAIYAVGNGAYCGYFENKNWSSGDGVHASGFVGIYGEGTGLTSASKGVYGYGVNGVEGYAVNGFGVKGYSHGGGKYGGYFGAKTTYIDNNGYALGVGGRIKIDSGLVENTAISKFLLHNESTGVVEYRELDLENPHYTSIYVGDTSTAYGAHLTGADLFWGRNDSAVFVGYTRADTTSTITMGTSDAGVSVTNGDAGSTLILLDADTVTLKDAVKITGSTELHSDTVLAINPTTGVTGWKLDGASSDTGYVKTTGDYLYGQYRIIAGESGYPLTILGPTNNGLTFRGKLSGSQPYIANSEEGPKIEFWDASATPGIMIAEKLFFDHAGVMSIYNQSYLKSDSIFSINPTTGATGYRMLRNQRHIYIDSTNNNYGVGESIFKSLTTGKNNISIGDSCLYKCSSGGANIGLGTKTLFSIAGGNFNNGHGHNSLYYTTNGVSNNGYGYSSLFSNTTGSQNSGYGNLSLYIQSTASNCIGLGSYSGYYNTLSDRLYIDSRQRANLAGDTTGAIIYGYMNNTPSLQRLTFNTAKVTATGNLSTQSFNAKIVVADSGNYTVTATDHSIIKMIRVSATDDTIVLPAPSANTGRILKIAIYDYDTKTGSGTVTLNASTNSGTIQDSTTSATFANMLSLGDVTSSAGVKVEIQCDGTKWWVLNI